MEERKFPIYSIHAVWDDDAYQPNQTSFEIMFAEEKTQDEIDAYAQSWWDTYVVTPSRWNGVRPTDRNPRNVRLTAKYVEHETWCDTWFSHYTLNTHLDDATLHQSFSEYVERKKRELARRGVDHHDYAALMGAADYWRWKEPCRCEGCTKRGVVTIDH